MVSKHKIVKRWLCMLVAELQPDVHFLPLFLMPPEVRGPFPAAFFCISASFFCSSFCLFLWARSSSSISLACFLGAFSGFFFPPSRPDIVLTFSGADQRKSDAHVLSSPC